MAMLTAHRTDEPLLNCTTFAVPRVSPLPLPSKFYPTGTEIFGQGEKAGNLYQIEFGTVRVYRLLADGRRQISAFHLAGETFGFEADTMHHFFAEAVCGTGIRTFRLSTTNDKANELLQLALRCLTRAQQHLLVLGRQNATERVAAFLVDLAERQGAKRQVDLVMSRTDIADYLGLTIETVSRVFSKLREGGFIRLRGIRNIEIVKLEALSTMSE
jgi:CRP/FNR family transcriptional regulator, nitrogen fixation regulation protein